MGINGGYAGYGGIIKIGGEKVRYEMIQDYFVVVVDFILQKIVRFLFRRCLYKFF